MSRFRAYAVALVAVVLVGVGVTWIGAGGGVVDDRSENAFVQADVGFDFTAGDSVGSMGNTGVYVTDYNNDLWPDLLAVSGQKTVLFENTGGAFERSGALPPLDGGFESALFFDYDNDGWDDLLLVSRTDAVFLINQNGNFERRDVGIEANFTRPVATAAADFNRDGYPDVFIAQYGDWTDRRPAGFRTEKEITNDNGNPNLLFAGSDDGFDRLSGRGIEGNHWSLATSFVDLTGDGLPDIHVANDFNNDVLYVNRGDGTFERRVLGEATDRNGMSSEVADVNGDGRLDIFVTNIFGFNYDGEGVDPSLLPLGARARGNNLLINQGDGTFVDRAETYGVREGGWGWAAVFTDFDNDGDEDLFHTTQIIDIRYDPQQTQRERRDNYERPRLWMQTSDGFRPVDGRTAGFQKMDGRGAAALDFDLDGDMDLAVANDQGEYVLYENQRTTGNSIEVVVKSSKGPVVGTVVTIETANGAQTEVRNSKADFQSQDTRSLHFGVGEAESVRTLHVVWPDGTERTVTDVAVGQRIVVTQEGIQRTEPLTSSFLDDVFNTLWNFRETLE